MTVTAGTVLRAWRNSAGLTLRELAARLGRQPSAVSMWENDQRSPNFDEAGQRQSPLDVVRLIADRAGWAKDEQDAMVDMWRLAGSDTALPPRHAWSHNYDSDGGPVWVWLRCPPTPATNPTVTLGWGPFGHTLHMPDSADGLLVHAPTSAPNPPLEITFSGVGWADFGRGVVPDTVAEQLSIHIVDGRDDFDARFVDPPELHDDEKRQLVQDLHAIRKAADRLRVVWSRVAPRLGAMRPNTEFRSLEATSVVESGWSGPIARDPHGVPISQLLQDRHRLRLIRDQRGLSRDAAADEVNRLATNRSPG